jgi:hypothetical protein
VKSTADHGFEVLDVHHHVGDAFSALGGDLDPTGGMSAEEHERVELESRLAIMDDAGVARAVVIPGHGYLRPEGVATFGADRVLFGTDLYSWPVGRRISHLLTQIVESGLDETDKALVLGGTPRGSSASAAPDRRQGVRVRWNDGVRPVL